MKMTQAHYEILRDAFKVTLSDEVKRLEVDPAHPKTVAALIAYHKLAYSTANLTERRMHFDLFWWVRRRSVATIEALMREFYEYANDDHLYTALKAIVKEMQQ